VSIYYVLVLVNNYYVLVNNLLYVLVNNLLCPYYVLAGIYNCPESRRRVSEYLIQCPLKRKLEI
jgi:hypothetical protein